MKPPTSTAATHITSTILQMRDLSCITKYNGIAKDIANIANMVFQDFNSLSPFLITDHSYINYQYNTAILDRSSINCKKKHYPLIPQP